MIFKIKIPIKEKCEIIFKKNTYNKQNRHRYIKKAKKIGRSPCKFPCYTGFNKFWHYIKFLIKQKKIAQKQDEISISPCLYLCLVQRVQGIIFVKYDENQVIDLPFNQIVKIF